MDEDRFNMAVRQFLKVVGVIMPGSFGRVLKISRVLTGFGLTLLSLSFLKSSIQ